MQFMIHVSFKYFSGVLHVCVNSMKVWNDTRFFASAHILFLIPQTATRQTSINHHVDAGSTDDDTDVYRNRDDAKIDDERAAVRGGASG